MRILLCWDSWNFLCYLSHIRQLVQCNEGNCLCEKKREISSFFFGVQKYEFVGIVLFAQCKILYMGIGTYKLSCTWRFDQFLLLHGPKIFLWLLLFDKKCWLESKLGKFRFLNQIVKFDMNFQIPEKIV